MVLNAYIAWKEKALDRFNGMFAFVVYDSVEKELFVHIDQHGNETGILNFLTLHEAL